MHFFHVLGTKRSGFKPRGEHRFSRSSRLEVLCEKGVLRNFPKFYEFYEISSNTFFIEHLRTVASAWALRPAVFRKETLAQMFLCEFCEFFKNTFSYRTPPIAASASNLMGPPVLKLLEFLEFFWNFFSNWNTCARLLFQSGY